MKKTLLTVMIGFVVMTVFGQAFEGKVLYAYTYKTKSMMVTDQKWSSALGATESYYIKGGDYKSITNGTLIQWQLYINKDNKLYSKSPKSETVFWNDGSVQGDVVYKSELKKNVAEVLGYKCDELILTCKSGVQEYFFNAALSVDAKLYTSHKFGNWYDYLSKANALPLKMILDTDQVTIECIATEIKPMKLDANLFELPAGTKTKKSPF
jgi:hypothetical protein